MSGRLPGSSGRSGSSESSRNGRNLNLDDHQGNRQRAGYLGVDDSNAMLFANAVRTLMAEGLNRFNENCTNLVLIPATPNTLFTTQQNEELLEFINGLLDSLPSDLQNPRIILTVPNGIINAECLDDIAIVAFVLIVSMWNRSRVSVVYQQSLQRRVVRGDFPGLTYPADRIINQIRFPRVQDDENENNGEDGQANESNIFPNTSDWHILNTERIEGGLRVNFDVDFRSALALDERKMRVIYKGQIIQLS